MRGIAPPHPVFASGTSKNQGTTMGFLQDKKILVTGLLSTRSIAFGIAKALAREGAALAFTYQSAELRSRVEELAAEFRPPPGSLWPAPSRCNAARSAPRPDR